MKTVKALANYPAGKPILADDLLEFHAARLVLLLHICGKRNRIQGLTKLAKLDFFVRYPQFFEKASEYQGNKEKASLKTVESSMIRFHYGPWDKRYYQVIPFLEANQLIELQQDRKSYSFTLTEQGKGLAKQLLQDEAFAEICDHMRQVKKVFGGMTGSKLKSLIYEIFKGEVADKAMEEVI